MRRNNDFLHYQGRYTDLRSEATIVCERFPRLHPLKSAGMEKAVMDEILRQRDMELREAVRAGLAGEVKTAFAKLGDRVAQAEPDRISHEAAERWLSLSPEQRETAGVIAPTRALRDRINETIR